VGADRRRRAWLRGLCGMFSSFFGSGSGGSSGVDFCVIFPPPQQKHAKEFRDRAFLSPFFMLCKMRTSIKIPESSVPAFSNQGGKSCILAVKTPAFNGNKILATDDGKTICKSSFIWRVSQKFRASQTQNAPTDVLRSDLPSASLASDRKPSHSSSAEK